MTSKDLNEKLLNSFPELQEKFKEETEWQEGIHTGSIVVYEDVFIPFLTSACEEKTAMADKVSDFIEELAFSDDEYVQNLLVVAVFENIDASQHPEKYISFFRPRTKELYSQYHEMLKL